jgi:uncharacterized membrane protein
MSILKKTNLDLKVISSILKINIWNWKTYFILLIYIWILKIGNKSYNKWNSSKSINGKIVSH